MPDEALGVLLRRMTRLDDALVFTIVAATYAESSLTSILRDRVDHPEVLGNKSGGLPFRHLVKVAIALGGVPLDMRRPLDLLAKCRNDFAHNITYRIPPDQIEALNASLPTGLVFDRGRNDTHAPPIKLLQYSLLSLCLELFRCNLTPAERLDRFAFADHVHASLRNLPQNSALRAGISELPDV